MTELAWSQCGPATCIACDSLRHVEWRLLAPLSEADRDGVLKATRLRRYARNEVVFHEEDPGDCLHLVKDGRLGVQVGLDSGESLTLSVLSPGDAFGELAVLGKPHRRTATVVAWEPAETLSLTGAAFTALCRDNPRIERLVLTLLAERVDELSRRLIEALYVDVDRRVCRRLAELCEIYGQGVPGTVIPLSQDEIAGLAGTSRPSVNQVIQRLAAERLLTAARRHIVVLRPDELRRQARR